MIKWICTFRIGSYGHSGTELPPPRIGGFSHSILAMPNEGEQSFRERMQVIGMHIRAMQTKKFKDSPKPYSCEDSCDWSITSVGNMIDLFEKVKTL